MPNVGKSTLMNCLLGEHLSVATSKAQTTRHRILGVANGEGHQLVLQDTPGILEDAKYTLHERMMGAVRQALDDGEVVLLVTDPFAPAPLPDEAVRAQLRRTDRPLFVAINKVDLYDDDAATGRPRMRPETRADVGRARRRRRALARRDGRARGLLPHLRARRPRRRRAARGARRGGADDGRARSTRAARSPTGRSASSRPS